MKLSNYFLLSITIFILTACSKKEIPEQYVINTKYKEANILGLPVISVVNTNFDPSLVSYPIPGNNRAISVYAYLSKVLLNLLQRTQK